MSEPKTPTADTAARLAELIERLEKCEGPSPILDEMIAAALFGTPEQIRLVGMDDEDPPVFMYRYLDGSQGTALRYTASLDAALTLVPEGCSTHLHIMPREIGHKTEVGIDHVGLSCTPAIALCIAALRARLALLRAAATQATTQVQEDGK